MTFESGPGTLTSQGELVLLPAPQKRLPQWREASPPRPEPPPTMTEREMWFSMCMPNDLALPIYATTSLLHNASISRLDDRKGKRKGKGKNQL